MFNNQGICVFTSTMNPKWLSTGIVSVVFRRVGGHFTDFCETRLCPLIPFTLTVFTCQTCFTCKNDTLRRLGSGDTDYSCLNENNLFSQCVNMCVYEMFTFCFILFMNSVISECVRLIWRAMPRTNILLFTFQHVWTLKWKCHRKRFITKTMHLIQ